ncbi:DUF3568 family protein [Poriferisphaera sp. WC338]|uniref:DUF3568 family protein n=1 Tax=Poriferisphaera sp. WC338 TaxID=3425129 RepID=UPI003D81B3BD
MLKSSTALMSLFAVVLTITLLGCSTSQPNVTNDFGTITGYVDGNPQAVATATEKALTDQKYIVINKYAGADDAKIIARTDSDEKVEIRITKQGNNVSKVQIHVGSMGNEPKSLEIFDNIRQHM